jgi:hypothetical protein
VFFSDTVSHFESHETEFTLKKVPFKKKKYERAVENSICHRKKRFTTIKNLDRVNTKMNLASH